MARSQVDICNNALRRLGQNTIAALDEDSPQARLCNQIYDSVQDSLLVMHPWNFAIKRETLAQLVATPEYEYDYMYQLPSDCLRVLSANVEQEVGYVWQIEAGALLTNADEVSIKYIYREDDPVQYSSSFYDLFATRMAAELAYSIAKDKQLAGNMWDLYNYKLTEARAMDGMEGTTLPLLCNDLINVRYVTGGPDYT